jgi:hypothetical protein
MTDHALARLTLSERTEAAMGDVLAGRRHGFANALLFAGPAVIASIAYMDPGNFATNIQAGARYGYALLWVVVLANLIAMLFQALSAKLGIVTGHNLAELCRTHFPKPVVVCMWVVSEIAAMATDLAEFLGGAIGLSLLLHLPLIVGMGITAIVTYAILLLGRNGFRPMELIIGALVATVAVCYVAEMFIAHIDWGAAAFHSIVPSLPGGTALTIAVGIVGATVMPHAIYLHSGLTQGRMPAKSDDARHKLVHFSNMEVIVALAAAGLVNMAMVMMAAAAFHAPRRRGHLPCLAAGIRHFEFRGRHDGRPDDHARLHRIPYSRLAAAARDDDPGFHRCRARRQCDAVAGAQPGRSLDRAACADDRARLVHAPHRYHGAVRQQPPHGCCRDRRHAHHSRAECRTFGAGRRDKSSRFAGELNCRSCRL